MAGRVRPSTVLAVVSPSFEDVRARTRAANGDVPRHVPFPAVSGSATSSQRYVERYALDIDGSAGASPR